MKKSQLKYIDCSKHKKKGKCRVVSGCKNQMRTKGICPLCGVRRYSKNCKIHLGNGKKVPRMHGKRTTKTAREKRKKIVEQITKTRLNLR